MFSEKLNTYKSNIAVDRILQVVYFEFRAINKSCSVESQYIAHSVLISHSKDH